MKTNMHYGALPAIFLYAKKLRQHPTKAEALLWNHLRKHALGQKFRRQHPIWLYVADFYCHRLRLVIEIDGGIHEDEETRSKDLQKENDFASFELTVIRFSNEEVLFDLDNVISRIYLEMKSIEGKNFRKKNFLQINPSAPPCMWQGSDAFSQKRFLTNKYINSPFQGVGG